MKEVGYDVMHNGKCITIFSAPNYCDQMGNKGAFIHFGEDCKPKYTTFDASVWVFLANSFRLTWKYLIFFQFCCLDETREENLSESLPHGTCLHIRTSPCLFVWLVLFYCSLTPMSDRWLMLVQCLDLFSQIFFSFPFLCFICFFFLFSLSIIRLDWLSIKGKTTRIGSLHIFLKIPFIQEKNQSCRRKEINLWF